VAFRERVARGRPRALIAASFFGLMMFSQSPWAFGAEAAPPGLENFRSDFVAISTALQNLGGSGAADLRQRLHEVSDAELNALREQLSGNPDWDIDKVLQLLTAIQRTRPSRPSAPSHPGVVIDDPEPLPAICNNFPLSLEATIGLATTQNILFAAGFALHAGCDIVAGGFSQVGLCVAAAVAEVAAAVFQGILIVSDVCEGQQNSNLFTAIFNGKKATSQQLENIQAQVNNTGEAIDRATRLQLEEVLADCPKLTTLIIDDIEEDLAKARDLVEELIEGAQQAGVGVIPQATTAFRKGVTHFKAKQFDLAYSSFCKADQSLAK
jgi:hypothetical protein